MKIVLASLAALGFSLAPLSAQCCESQAKSSCDTKQSCETQTACDSKKQDCESKKDCGSCGDKATMTSSAKVGFAQKLAKMSAKERKQVVEAMGYLSKHCPVGSRMGTTMKTLDELYSGAIANLKNAHASGKLAEAEKAQVAKTIGLLQKAQTLNAESLNGYALLVGAPAGAKKGGECGEGGCGDSTAKKEDCSDSECVGCAGSCGDKAVATSDCSASIAYSKRLCASWAKAGKEAQKLDAETTGKLKEAFAVIEPLGMIQGSTKSLQQQASLVRAAVKTMPCSSKVGCPGTAKTCDNGSEAMASVYALLSSLPVHGNAAKAGGKDCGSCESKTECSESKTECSSTKTECSESKSCGGAKTVKQ